jgi:hypothetical protein
LTPVNENCLFIAVFFNPCFVRGTLFEFKNLAAPLTC